MTKVHAKRLLKLADYLAAFQEPSQPAPGAVGFDMRLIYTSDPAQLGEEPDEWLAKHPCGTVACVLGHAGLIPQFQKLGLGVVDSDNGAGHITLAGEADDIEHVAETFFGLDHDEAFDLFLDFYDMDAQGKATQIRKIVKRHHRDLVKAVRA